MMFDYNITRLQELIAKAADGVLEAEEQLELNELLRNKVNLRQYLQFIETAGILRKIPDTTRPVHRSIWPAAGGMIAAGIALFISLWIIFQENPQPIPKTPVFTRKSTIFSDQVINRRVTTLRRKLKDVSNIRQFSKTSKPYNRLQRRIRRLKRQPIFRKEINHVEKGTGNSINLGVKPVCIAENLCRNTF